MQDGPSSPPDAAPLINYRDGHDDLPQNRGSIGQAIGGALLSIVTVCGLVAFWILANLNLAPPAPPPPLEWRTPTQVTLLAVAFVAAITLLARYRYNKRSFALGVLIGVGVAALVEGICFGVSLR